MKQYVLLGVILRGASACCDRALSDIIAITIASKPRIVGMEAFTNTVMRDALACEDKLYNFQIDYISESTAIRIQDAVFSLGPAEGRATARGLYKFVRMMGFPGAYESFDFGSSCEDLQRVKLDPDANKNFLRPLLSWLADVGGCA